MSFFDKLKELFGAKAPAKEAAKPEPPPAEEALTDEQKISNLLFAWAGEFTDAQLEEAQKTFNEINKLIESLVAKGLDQPSAVRSGVASLLQSLREKNNRAVAFCYIRSFINAAKKLVESSAPNPAPPPPLEMVDALEAACDVMQASSSVEWKGALDKIFRKFIAEQKAFHTACTCVFCKDATKKDTEEYLWN